MSELPVEAEVALAAMSESEVTELLHRVRNPDEFDDPMAKAARAMRRELGSDQRGHATKSKAADAVRAYRANN